MTGKNLAQPQEIGPVQQALTALGSVGAAVFGAWLGWSQQVASDAQSMTFFTIMCTVASVLLGALMLVLRRYNMLNRKVVFVVALAFTVIGFVAFFRYEYHYDRHITWRQEEGARQAVVVTSTLRPEIFRAAAEKYCGAEEILNPAGFVVSSECAKVIGARFDSDDLGNHLFNLRELSEARNAMVFWYRLASAAIMLALFFAVDWFLAEISAKKPEPPATPPADDSAAAGG